MKRILFAAAIFSLVLFSVNRSMSASYKALTPQFANACFRECTKNKSKHPDCGTDSLKFVVQQYNLAASGETPGKGGLWYCSDGSRTYDCRYWRSKQLHDVCPATMEGAKVPRWWVR